MSTKVWASTASTDWSVSANWSPTGVPAASDDVYFDATSVIDIAAGLGQSTVTLGSMTIASTYTGKIGTASAYLQVSATILTIGTPSNSSTTGQGSNRIKIDLGSVQSSISVQSTASTGTDAGLEPVRLIGTHASNTLAVTGGRVGIATTSPGESATLATVSVGTDAIVNLGAGCTLTTVNNNGGTLTTNSAITTLNSIAGTTTTKGTGLIGTINASGGNLNLSNRRSGTDITSLNFAGGVLDFRGSPDSVTIGSTAITKGGSVRVFSASQVNWGTVTFDPTYSTELSMTTK